MDTPELFDIVPFNKDATIESLPEPTNGPYYIAAGNGFFVHRNFHFGRVIVPAKPDNAPDMAPMLWYQFDPPIPHQLIGQAYSFFRAIYEKRKSEAMVDITWNREKGYRLFVPPQRASGGGVSATRNLEHYQGQIVGTIHSHCNFNAFHSGTDTHDADSHDGLHITIGDVLKEQPSIAIMISVSKKRWDKFKLEDISDGPLEIVPHPEWWEPFVGDPAPKNTGHVSTWKRDDDDNVVWSSGSWRPPAAHKPSGPTKNTPMIVFGGNASDKDYGSLESLVAQNRTLFDRGDAWALEFANDELDDARQTLDSMGIELQYSFKLIDAVNTDPEPTSPSTDLGGQLPL